MRIVEFAFGFFSMVGWEVGRREGGREGQGDAGGVEWVC